jgi:hypothetical protein
MPQKPIKKKISLFDVILVIPLIFALIFFVLFVGAFIISLSGNMQSSVSGSNLPLIQSNSSNLSLPIPTNSQTIRNIRIVKEIVEEYHKTHPYSGSDISVCGDMATDVWNMVHMQGINAVIIVGNVDKEISNINDANHVWVLAETSPNQWVALDATGGFVVCNDPDFCPINSLRYYYGWGYNTPNELNDALDTLKHRCPDGYILGNDEMCHLACGANTYCSGDSVCIYEHCMVPIMVKFWEMI